MGFDLLLLGLTLSPAVKYYRSMKSMESAAFLSGTLRHGAESSLAYILLRDSITFPFMYVFNYPSLPVVLISILSRNLVASIGNLIVYMREPVCRDSS